MVSRYFAKPATAAVGAGARVKREPTKPRDLCEAAAQARASLQTFQHVAKKKNAHKEHEAAAEAVLIAFRPFLDSKAAAAAAAASGDVVVSAEDGVIEVLKGEGKDSKALALADVDSGGGGGGGAGSGGGGGGGGGIGDGGENMANVKRAKRVNAVVPGGAGAGKIMVKVERKGVADDDGDGGGGGGGSGGGVTRGGGRDVMVPVLLSDSDLPGAREAGEVLAGALAELERLHVNASCRVRQRAPVVAAARARLTALRRECRGAFKAGAGTRPLFSSI